MPGLALIFARDGAPVDARRLARFAHGLEYRGGSAATWIDGPIGLAQIGSRQAPATRVAASRDGGVRAVFDGRLYNGVELAAMLRCGDEPAVDDDATIAAEACARWGADAAARLRGDFAIAAWNARDREVLLVRDVRGLKPLYVRLGDRELCCASDLRTLVLDGTAVPNEGMVAEWLTGAPASHRETIYAGISRLPMAHLAVIGPASSRQTQYWRPSIDPSLVRRDAADRASAFAALLDDTVRERCDAAGPVAVMLSGGLDSSSVAAAVAARRREWASFTLAADTPSDDERHFAAAVAAHLKSDHVIVEAQPVSPGEAAADAAFSLDIPSPPNGLQSVPLRQAAVARGYTVALSGLGSDEWFSGSFLLYADLARRAAFVDLARNIWSDRHRDEPARVRLQIAAWALCPPFVRQQVRRLFGRPRAAALVSDEFARRTCLHDRLRAIDVAPPALESLSQQALYTETTCGSYAAAIDMQERGNARAGLDERYPFHDRRMIEFSLGLPESDRWHQGRYKSVIRRAMAGRLPPAVLARQQSPNANPVLVHTLRTAGRAFFERLEIDATGWVDRRRVLDAWDAFERGPRANALAWDLWAVAAVELWCRQAMSGHNATAALGGRTSVA